MDRENRRPTKLILDIALILFILAIGAVILLVTNNKKEQGLIL